MFAILVPASLSPLIITLFWAEQKARKLGLIAVPPTKPDTDSQSTSLIRRAGPHIRRAWTFAQQLDFVGLLLIGTSVALILLPLTLAVSAKGGWKNGESLPPHFKYIECTGVWWGGIFIGALIWTTGSIDDRDACRWLCTPARDHGVGGQVRETSRPRLSLAQESDCAHRSMDRVLRLCTYMHFYGFYACFPTSRS